LKKAAIQAFTDPIFIHRFHYQRNTRISKSEHPANENAEQASEPQQYT
jgi:hypothetical protein